MSYSSTSISGLGRVFNPTSLAPPEWWQVWRLTAQGHNWMGWFYAKPIDAIDLQNRLDSEQELSVRSGTFSVGRYDLLDANSNFVRSGSPPPMSR